MSSMQIYVVAVIHLGAVATLLPVYYHSQAPWRSTTTGRALMASSTSLAVLYWVAVTGYWWPFSGYMFIYAVAVTGVTAAAFYKATAIRQAQRRTDARAAKRRRERRG